MDSVIETIYYSNDTSKYTYCHKIDHRREDAL